MTLPSGTVTFLFTDIEGSTRLVERLGDDAYRDVLDAERSLIAEAGRAEGGSLFGSEGDGHFLAFDSAPAAIRAAVAGQRALAAGVVSLGGVQVRMGIHAGEAQLVDGDYVGFEVHRAARVAAAGHGGQILVSDTARALAVGSLPEGVTIRELGEHRLKDLPRPERLSQVVATGLRDRFPPLRSVEAATNNLPAQLTSFVGRPELVDALALLRRSRLLTLTGPGGTGKTRLSLALATAMLPDLPGGAWFVPLASVTDPALVASSIATAVGLLSPNRDPLDRVLEHFADRTALLVLDNFEQVVAAAPLVAELLGAAPRLTVLVSSRAPLRVTGEQEFPVPPLSVPPPDARDAASVGGSQAVALFVDRATAVRPDFRLSDDNAAAVAEIVRRLDGLPLALELAAARTRLLSPAAMVARLEDRFALLASGARDLPDRQRTLRGAIAWSHDLLGHDEQRLFARLAVFAGSGTLEMAEEVCGERAGDPSTSGRAAIAGGRVDVPAALESLVEQSLARVESDRHGDVRFTMLETIGEYALERLIEGEGADAFRERHAAAFLGLVRAFESDGAGHDRRRWLDRLEDDHDNLRASLDRLIARNDPERAAAFVHGVWRFWQQRGHVAEGRSRVQAVLDLPGWRPSLGRARLAALEAAGGLAYWSGDMAPASAHYAEAERVARELGDDAELANALYNHFFAYRPTESADEWIATLTGDTRALVDEALAIWRRLGDEHGVGRALWGLAEHHSYRTEVPEAIAMASEALAIFERLDDTFWAAWARFTRGWARAMGGDVTGSAFDLGAALRDFSVAGDVSGLALSMAVFGSVLLLAERPVDATRFGAAARRLEAETGVHLVRLWPSEWTPRPEADPTDPRLAAAVAEGAAWPRYDAVERAIALADELAPVPTRD